MTARRSEGAEPTTDALTGFVGFRLRRLHGHVLSHWSRWFRRLDVAVTPVQGGVLLLIDENPGLTQTALARLVKVEAPTLQQVLNPLVEAGLVERYRSPRDGRAIALHLSRAGRDVAHLVRAQGRAHEDALLAALTAEERATLIRLLDKALAGAEETR